MIGVAVSCLACSEGTAPVTPPADPHRAATVRLVSGDNQTGVVGTVLAKPVVIELMDSAGKPAWGRAVWGQETGSLVADRNGRVTIPWQLGPKAGAQSITVDPSGQDRDIDLVITAHATALVGPFDHVAPLRVTNAYSNWLTTTTIRRDTLFSPRDAFDNVVAWPADAKLSAAAPWSIRADTVVPPSPAFVGTTVIRVDAGGKSATSPVTRVDDLRAHRWHVSFTCATSGAPTNFGVTGATVLADSLTFAGTIRAIAYPGDVDYYNYPGKGGPTPPVQAYLQGTFTIYAHGGTTSTQTVTNYSEVLAGQRPDTLVYFNSANANGATGNVAVVTPGPLPSYTGGSSCDSTRYTVRPPEVWSAY